MTGPPASSSPRRRARIVVLLLLGAGITPARADDGKLDRLSKALVNLRSEVDSLDSQLRTERTQNLLELRELQRRKEELALLRDAEAVKQATLKQQLQRARDKQVRHRDARTRLAGAVVRGLDRLTASVKRSLPYRLEERLAAISELRLRLGAGRIEPAAAAVKLWRLVEDELRLAMTVERAEIPLAIDGKTRLVRVVRLGTVTLYTSLSSGRYGRLVRRQHGAWRHVVVDDPRARDQIAALFRALERQVREGLYRLPLPALVERGQP